MSKKHEFTLKNALLSTGVVQPISSMSSSKSVSVLCRAVPGQDPSWVKAMEALLQAVPEGAVHLCKKFVLRDAKLVFGWHISVETKSAKGLVEVVATVCGVLKTVRPSLVVEAPRVAKAVVAEPMDPTLLKKIGAPRSAGEPGMVQQVAPGNFVFSKKVTQRKVGSNGAVTIIEEMPIPHVYSEMNRPNSKGRGAKSVMEE